MQLTFVSSLYTEISNHEGILAIVDHMRSDPDKQKPHLLKLQRLVLHSMSFSFNGDHYLQVEGTAMGTAASNYACLFMDRFETKVLANWPLKPVIWLRFIDDIFMIWTNGEDNLSKFISYLNEIHPTIKFTHESSPTQIDFLDTTVKVNNSREIYTTVAKDEQITPVSCHFKNDGHSHTHMKFSVLGWCTLKM